MKKYIFTLLMINCLSTYSQSVYITKFKSQADITICIVDYKSQADILVYKTSCRAESKHNDGLWFFTKNKTSANLKVYITTMQSIADLKVYYVHHKSQAAWKNKTKINLIKKQDFIIILMLRKPLNLW